MEIFNENEGVWRTIGGRRVFIRTGQRLSDAMRESGKFKTKSGKVKKEDSSKEIKKDNVDKEEYELFKKAMENPDSIDPMTENSIDWEALEKKYKGRYEKENKKDYHKIEKQLLDDYTKVETEDLKTYRDTFKEQGKEKFAERLQKEIDKRDSVSKKENKKDFAKLVATDDTYKAVADYENGAKDYEQTLKRFGGDKEKLDARFKEMGYNSPRKTEEGRKYRSSLTKLNDKSIEDGTYDLDTGKKVDFGNKGYNVSFEQSSDNYSDSEYFDKIEECRKLCDGKVYGGKFGGSPEISFYTEDKETAMKIMEKYNQHSIYDNSIGDVIENAKYNAETNKVNYKSTNETMNEAIRAKASKKTKAFKDDLPKKVEIKTQGTSNRKEVSENIQAHILDYYDSPDDFIRQMDVFDNLPTKWHAGKEIAKGGSYLVYNQDMSDFLDSLKINPKGKKFSDEKAFDMYTSLIGRESEKLYNRLQKNAYNKYMKEHPLSKMNFEEFLKMRKGD